MDFKNLQRGAAIVGAAEGENAVLTLDSVTAVIAGFTEFLSKKTGIDFSRLRISVGRDPRPSSRGIKKAVINQLLSQGIAVSDCDLCSTPAIFMTTVNDYCDGAVCITAGNEPREMNGFRFFTRDGAPGEKEISEILDFAAQFDASPYCERGELENEDYMALYCHNLRNVIRDAADAEDHRHPLRGLRIAAVSPMDAAQFYNVHILRVLGADTTPGDEDLYIEFDIEALSARVRCPDGKMRDITDILNDVAVPTAASVTSPAISDGTYLVSKLVIKLALLHKNGEPLKNAFQYGDSSDM